MSEAANNVVPVQPRPALVAGQRPQAIVPVTMEETWRLATSVTEAGMNPPGLETPQKVFVAMLQGLEVGMTPMAAIQRIAVINGRATIWGDGAMGLVRASGICEWIKERVEGDGDARTAICEAKRKGDPEPVRRAFSVADAKRAGLWDERAKVTRRGREGGTYEARNDSPWHRFPERMMQMRARAFALRDLFADVLGGLYIREEIEEPAPQEEQRKLVAPPPPPPPAKADEKVMVAQPGRKLRPPPPPGGVAEVAGKETRAYLAEDKADAEQAKLVEDASYVDLVEEQDTADPDQLVEDYQAELSEARDLADFQRIRAAYQSRIAGLPPEHGAEADRITAEHRDRF